MGRRTSVPEPKVADRILRSTDRSTTCDVAASTNTGVWIRSKRSAAALADKATHSTIAFVAATGDAIAPATRSVAIGRAGARTTRIKGGPNGARGCTRLTRRWARRNCMRTNPAAGARASMPFRYPRGAGPAYRNLDPTVLSLQGRDAGSSRKAADDGTVRRCPVVQRVGVDIQDRIRCGLLSEVRSGRRSRSDSRRSRRRALDLRRFARAFAEHPENGQKNHHARQRDAAYCFGRPCHRPLPPRRLLRLPQR